MNADPVSFIISQSIVLIAWIAYNLMGGAPFDPWPFILLNLALSLTNVQAKEEIEALQEHLPRLEIEKLNEILQLLQTVRKEKVS
jgi:uncharacterized membrane protein